MCLQNYLIFYLEVIPPLSFFIALYMTEVGEQHQMRPSPSPSGGSVHSLTSARPTRPQECLHFSNPPPSPKPARSVWRLLPPYQVWFFFFFFFSLFLPYVNFIVFLSEREVAFREAVIFEEAANAWQRLGTQHSQGQSLSLAFPAEVLVL